MCANLFLRVCCLRYPSLFFHHKPCPVLSCIKPALHVQSLTAHQRGDTVVSTLNPHNTCWRRHIRHRGNRGTRREGQTLIRYFFKSHPLTQDTSQVMIKSRIGSQIKINHLNDASPENKTHSLLWTPFSNDTTPAEMQCRQSAPPPVPETGF